MSVARPSEGATTLAEALARVQAKLPHVGKDKTAQVKSEKGSYSYSYADLADIAQALMPLLAAEGLAWTARPTLDEHGRFVLAYSLIHGPSGEREDGSYPLPDPGRATPQQVGSAITYGRRYCLTAVTGMVVGGEDDDGAAASSQAAAPVDPLGALKAQVWREAQAKGFSTPVAVSEAFAEWSAGETLASANVDALTEFLAHLRKQEAA